MAREIIVASKAPNDVLKVVAVIELVVKVEIRQTEPLSIAVTAL